MKNVNTVSKAAIVLAVVLGVVGFISMIISLPVCGISPRAMGMSSGLLLLFSIALSTLNNQGTPKQ